MGRCDTRLFVGLIFRNKISRYMEFCFAFSLVYYVFGGYTIHARCALDSAHFKYD